MSAVKQRSSFLSTLCYGKCVPFREVSILLGRDQVTVVLWQVESCPVLPASGFQSLNATQPIDYIRLLEKILKFEQVFSEIEGRWLENMTLLFFQRS